MKKENWVQLKADLEESLKGFYSNKTLASSAKKKSVRQDAYAELKSIINRFHRVFKGNLEAEELFLKRSPGSPQGEGEFLSDFGNPDHFLDIADDFMDDIDNKIKILD